MKTVALLYGGKSGEHEVSLISAASVLKNLDAGKYKLLLIGIAKSGEWLLQDPSLAKKMRAAQPAAGSGEGQPDMSGLPPIQAGRKVTIAPGAGLLAQKKDGSFEALACDIVFPVLHGSFGEDGTVQGLLECAGLPYVGAGVLGSAVGMDKQIAKELWRGAGLPVVDAIALTAADRENPQSMAAIERKIEARFGWPCFVKPASCGSSVGASKVADAEGLGPAIDAALKYDEKVLIEQFINAREIECAVLGNESPRTFVPGEIAPTHEFYDYDAKYKDPDGASLCIPAPLSPAQAETVKTLAIKAYKACAISGMARVDFFIDKLTGNILLNELNTIPGFTAISMYPQMCVAGGLPYPALLDELIALGFERFNRRAALSYSYDDMN